MASSTRFSFTNAQFVVPPPSTRIFFMPFFLRIPSNF
ncbi:uncharacterized protein METZ01_LOCUS301132, partial [marine metagenome]